MGIMSRESKPEEIVVPDSPAALATPKFTAIASPSSVQVCDMHPNTFAVVEVSRADWRSALLFCGNCARKNFGYEHTKGAAGQ